MATKTPDSEPAPRRRKVVKRTEINVRTAVHQWLLATDAVERFSQEVQTHRGMILEALETQGKPDDKGSQWLRFPDDPIDGRISGLQRQHRISRALNHERAEAWLKERGLLEQCTETITVLSEEKVLELAWPAIGSKRVMSDEEQDVLYVLKESWELVPQRVKL